jgi:hypothetical protein
VTTAFDSRRLDAMQDVPSAIGRLTRARFDSCPRSAGKVPADLGLVEAPSPAQELRSGRLHARALVPPTV